jgi:hypothetical protein
MREESFWKKVNIRGSDECWEWLAGTNKAGYGTFEGKRDGKTRKAHRIAYEFLIGPIPKGLHLLHSCDNPPCVNPAHLRPGSPKDNGRDCVERGRHPGINKTHCPKGHPYNEINMYFSNGRRCKACKPRWYNKKKASGI